MKRTLVLTCLVQFVVACANPETGNKTATNDSASSATASNDMDEDSSDNPDSEEEGSQVEDDTGEEESGNDESSIDESGEDDPSDSEEDGSASLPSDEDSDSSSDSSTSSGESSEESSGEEDDDDESTESSESSDEMSSESEESGESEESEESGESEETGESSDTGDEMFALTSPAYEEGGIIPDAHIHTSKQGQNISPELNWVGAPSEAKSFAVFFEDLSNGYKHSAIWDIPATATGLPEGVEHEPMPAKVPGAVQCKNWASRENRIEWGYGGPGTRVNTYQFTIYAIDVETISEINKDSSLREVHKALKDHSIGSASLSGKAG